MSAVSNPELLAIRNQEDAFLELAQYILRETVGNAGVGIEEADDAIIVHDCGTLVPGLGTVKACAPIDCHHGNRRVMLSRPATSAIGAGVHHPLFAI